MKKKVTISFNPFSRFWEVNTESPIGDGFPNQFFYEKITRFITEDEARDFATRWVEANEDYLELCI